MVVQLKLVKVTTYKKFKAKSSQQGVDTDSAYLLSDPAIHYGPTNIGEAGMKCFFKAHNCNDICKKLDLKRNKWQKDEAFPAA